MPTAAATGQVLPISNLVQVVPVLHPKAMAGQTRMDPVLSIPMPTVLLAVVLTVAAAAVTTAAAQTAVQETEDGKMANIFLALRTRNSSENCSAFPTIPPRHTPASTLPTMMTFLSKHLVKMFPNLSRPLPILLLTTT